MGRVFVGACVLAAAAACLAAVVVKGQKARRPAAKDAGTEAALAGVSGEEILRHIKVLASDEFEGRAPGSRGEELTVKYLTEQFQKLGLKPGNPDGTYVQSVPLVGQTASPSAHFMAGGKRIDLKSPDDYVAVTRRVVPEVSVEDSDVVFVGYGVVAPEYGWDDFKGVDVRGKTVVMLINDPPVPDPSDPSKLDEKTFKGRAMTYYGRWTYKYEMAAEKGAAACVIVHETGPAGYPYTTVVSGWGGENFDIEAADKNMGRAAVEGWMTLDRARELFAAAGQDFDRLKASAARRDFKPVALGAKASFRLSVKSRRVNSRNVVARLEGSDPKLKDEYVVYSAHWDAFGRDEKLAGDQIRNGALDNGSGVAEMLEIARAFRRLPKPPKRSVLFLAVTAEESGLLGAKFYAQNPLYPLERTLADVNMDMMNLWGRTKSVVSIGYGNTTLEDLLAEVAATQGKTVRPDPEPEKGFFYRSDHLEFMKRGVPALTFLHSGADYVDKPEDYGPRKRREYTERDYHKPSDEVKPDWDMAGAVDDVRLLFQVGLRVAEGERYPEWKPGTEFKARREEMLRRKGTE
ncbi:MAG: M28 family peptidase [Acidobacteria bacterium]|nr:M28 family peptidase [Acidobacteriota bacterium]